MIRITYQESNGIIAKVNITGHANYNDYGKDIVCAAVSSIAISTINGLLSIDDKCIKYSNDNVLSIENIKLDVVTNKLLLNMINMFIELVDTYPKNINVRKEEIK